MNEIAFEKRAGNELCCRNWIARVAAIERADRYPRKGGAGGTDYNRDKLIKPGSLREKGRQYSTDSFDISG